MDVDAVVAALRERLDLTNDVRSPPAVVAGLDVSYEVGTDRAAAAAVLIDVPRLAVVEHVTVVGEAMFPYVPGLLAFREAPLLMQALSGLRGAPEVLACDGYGIAHPRRFGLASHLGVLTGLPSMGVAKTPFVGSYEEPGERRGDWSPLMSGVGSDAGFLGSGASDVGVGGAGAGALGSGVDGPGAAEVLGRVLRTQAGVKPVFVSVGHRIGIDEATDLTLRLCGQYRLPETTRQADHLSRQALRELG